MTAHPLLRDLGTSPDIFIHQFDVAADRALLIRLSADQRRRASFLDDRILGAGVDRGWAAWRDAEPAARRASAAAPAFIFHVGHCGSTLISRLIEESAGVRSLREPAALRTLAVLAGDVADGAALWSEPEFARRLTLYLNVAAAESKTLIKATSWCCNLADRVSGPIIFCYSKPEAHIATMLGAPNNPIDLRLNAPARLRRLRRLCGAELADLSELSPGESAAMSWACEAATIAAADSRRLHAVEFDAFLADPHRHLSALAAHAGLDAAPERLRAALAGPIMQVYSKDPSAPYSPADRRALLAQYRAAQASEIARGLAWLGMSAARHPPIAAALQRFG
jgi:hypothetical protein